MPQRPRGGTPLSEERRREPRFPFIAAAHVQDEANGSRLPSRISDLSLHGCYVDIINPFPNGTSVQIKIFTETHEFEAPATVVYNHPHLGMGLLFRQVNAESMAVLNSWLPEAAATSPS
jgi:PilZ domain-containing protein